MLIIQFSKGGIMSRIKTGNYCLSKLNIDATLTFKDIDRIETADFKLT